ncbi:LysE family translocator [Neoroseomonas alba]|uniref:LysE family translocator n=1 Tax=Roseomonas alba TaxID=2846776 RepID=UPI0034E2FF7A
MVTYASTPQGSSEGQRSWEPPTVVAENGRHARCQPACPLHRRGLPARGHARTGHLLRRGPDAGGRPEGVASSVGTGLGGKVHVVAGGRGVFAIVLASAKLFGRLKLARAAYLVWIGLRTIRAARHHAAGCWPAVRHRRWAPATPSAKARRSRP